MDNGEIRDEDIIRVRINPHLVGKYLVKQLTELRQLKLNEQHQLEELISPLDAKSVEEICRYAADKKRIEAPLKNRLKAYQKSFTEDKMPTYEDVYAYFADQLTFLNQKETIDRLVVDLANEAYKDGITRGELVCGEIGEALFEPLHTHGGNKDVPAQENTHASKASLSKQAIEDAMHADSSTEPHLPANERQSAQKKKSRRKKKAGSFQSSSVIKETHSQNDLAQRSSLRINAPAFVPTSSSSLSEKSSSGLCDVLRPKPVRKTNIDSAHKEVQEIPVIPELAEGDLMLKEASKNRKGMQDLYAGSQHQFWSTNDKNDVSQQHIVTLFNDLGL